MKNTETNIVNPFHPDYVSQIKPFKPEDYKRPSVQQYANNPHANIAPSQEGKYHRLLKANI